MNLGAMHLGADGKRTLIPVPYGPQDFAQAEGRETIYLSKTEGLR